MKSEKDELVYHCRVCNLKETVSLDEADYESKEALAAQLCVHRHDLTYVAKEAIIVQPDVVHDPTLPRVYTYD